jgi:RNA polymerase sigma factor (TIGR02999 family)
VSQEASQTVSELLLKWRAGDENALQSLIPLVYKELRALAHTYLRSERPAHTLQTTALVHEAYLRLAGRPLDVEDRAHFIGITARLMRQILVDYARRHGAAKRGANQRVELETVAVMAEMPRTDVVALDEALQELAKIDEQQSRVVEMRFFGGLTTEEAADVLGISRSTAKRDWIVARAWLARQMKRGARGKP